MKGNRTAGRFSALLTIIIWGTTFISTKILLADFPPVQILCFRFAMGLLALLIVYPRRLKGTNRHQELTFAAAGLCGICLYYLLENSALTYTMASNVGVIISVAPFFTAILCRQRKSAAMATTPFSPPGGWSATASCLCSRYGSCDYSGDFRGNSP